MPGLALFGRATGFNNGEASFADPRQSAPKVKKIFFEPTAPVQLQTGGLCSHALSRVGRHAASLSLMPVEVLLATELLGAAKTCLVVGE